MVKPHILYPLSAGTWSEHSTGRSFTTTGWSPIHPSSVSSMPINLYSVFVRELQVPLNPRAIDQLFDLHNYNNDSDDYFSLFPNMTDDLSDKLLQEVTVPGTRWSCSKQGNKTCSREFLTTEAKVWFYFLRHSLMPTGHTSTLKMERVFLLACIMKGRSINVGKIICDQIRACANKKSGEIFFPTLICMLCRASGIVVTMVDDEYYSQGIISAYDLSRILPTPLTHPPRASSQTPYAQTYFTLLPTPAATPAFTLAQLHEHQQLYWEYVRDRDAANSQSLPWQRQQAGTPWLTFPHQILPDGSHTMEDDGDNVWSTPCTSGVVLSFYPSLSNELFFLPLVPSDFLCTIFIILPCRIGLFLFLLYWFLVYDCSIYGSSLCAMRTFLFLQFGGWCPFAWFSQMNQWLLFKRL